MRTRDVIVAAVFSPFLLAAGPVGMVLFAVIAAIGALWFVRAAWQFLGGLR